MKNVILIMLDSLRRDHVGAYGNEWIKTPNIDALADECVRFLNAYPEALPTLPVRRAMHTGMPKIRPSFPNRAGFGFLSGLVVMGRCTSLELEVDKGNRAEPHQYDR